MDDLDQQTRDLISNRINTQNNLTGDWQQDQGKVGGYQEFQPAKYDFGQNGLNNAIQGRANERFYDPAVANIQAMNKYNYAGLQQGRMKQVQQEALGEQRYDNARVLAAHQRVAQEEAQRAQLLQGILGFGGMVAGSALAGPLGGMAGSQLGKVGDMKQLPASGGNEGMNAANGSMVAYEGVS